jgi:hypothetical protein
MRRAVRDRKGPSGRGGKTVPVGAKRRQNYRHNRQPPGWYVHPREEVAVMLTIRPNNALQRTAGSVGYRGSVLFPGPPLDNRPAAAELGR